jgi:hypothetical protein
MIVQLHALAALFPVKGPWYPPNGRLGSPQSRYGAVEKIKLHLSYQESNSNSWTVQPLASRCYRLSYPDPKDVGHSLIRLNEVANSHLRIDVASGKVAKLFLRYGPSAASVPAITWFHYRVHSLIYDRTNAMTQQMYQHARGRCFSTITSH